MTRLTPNTTGHAASNSLRHITSTARKLSIASVTVVYNGAAAIRQHLDALKKQTHSLDEIILVNNASTDDTLSILAASYPEISILNLPTNTGVGGGLAAGLEYALKNKHDWIWLFDQDSRPEPNSLDDLLSGLSLVSTAQSVAILAPLCMHPETKMVFRGFNWNKSRLVLAPVPDQPVAFVDSVITSGSLIRKDAVEEAGLPRADFFMDFVDHEHCLRLRRHGFSIAMVRNSIVHHSLGEPKTFHFFGKTKFWTDHAPWREYYKTRNEIFTVWRFYPQLAAKFFALSRLLRHAAALLIFGKRKNACLAMMLRGLLDGRAGRLGIRFQGNEDASQNRSGEASVREVKTCSQM
jgi:rhamnosyltransferase